MAYGGDEIGGTPVDHALDQLVTSLDHLVKIVDDGGLDGYDGLQVVGFMRAFEQVRNRLPLVDHRIIADAERRELPSALCQGTMRRLLASTLRISRGEASRRVRAAAAVGERFSMLGEPLEPVRPCLAAAQRDGDISPEQVDLIERALSPLDRRGFDPTDLADGEELLVGHAKVFPPEDLRQLAQRVVDGIDPNGTLPDDQLNADRRNFYLRPTRNGAWTGEFRLTGAAGAKLKALLGPLAKPRLDATGQPDARTYGQRMHDALEEVCDRMLRAGDVPDVGGLPASVIVTIDYEDLLARTGHGNTTDGVPMSTDQILQLANTAEIIPAVLTAAGAVLSLGRTRRIASRTQTLALIARDGGCSFPGCSHPPQWCERHHIRDWAQGGPTDIDNLTLLCAYHHHNFAARGWTCRLNPDRIPEWIPPRWVDPDQKPMINTRIQAALAGRRPIRR
jgi:hypothetical protein